MPFGPIIGGALAGGGGLLSGIFGSDASSKAAQQQAQLEQQALNFQQSVYGNLQTQLNPYVTAGQNALGSILGFYGLPGGNSTGASAAFNQYTQTPSYQFPLQQGNLAINRQLASSGLTNSGAALKDATAYNQGYASQGLSQWLQGLGGIAGAGQSAAGTIGQQGNVAAGTLGQGSQYIGNALGQGTVNSANALSSGINNLLPGLIGNNSASSYGGSNSAVGQLSSYIGSLFSGGSGGYNPTSAGFTGNVDSSGANTLQSLGFFNPVSG
jgi:hypothetical protein